MENLKDLIGKYAKDKQNNTEGIIQNVYTNGITIQTGNGVVFVKYGEYELIEKLTKKTTT